MRIHPVYKETNAVAQLSYLLKSFSAIRVLTDDNTHRHCLPYIEEYLPSYEEIIIPSGEDHKEIRTLSSIWESLLEHNTGRDAVLINLGGGMVTDIGGMAAATYKRGISFIQVPTTLLGMVDAAIGGKTGINVQGIKNMAGTYSLPLATLIDPVFLGTLPYKEIRSGMAEIIKYALIHPARFSDEIFSLREIPREIPITWIMESAQIKEEIVNNDPTETGRRKTLNFGHTAGHALESLYGLSHGEAVAVGMCVALNLSVEKTGLDAAIARQYINSISHLYRQTFMRINSLLRLEDLWNLMQNDKKNTRNRVNFVLIKSPGTPIWDVVIEFDEFTASMEETLSLSE